MKKYSMSLVFGLGFCIGMSAADGEHIRFSKQNVQELYDLYFKDQLLMPIHVVRRAQEWASVGDVRAQAFVATVFTLRIFDDESNLRGSLCEQAMKVCQGFIVALEYRDLGVVNAIQVLREKSIEDLEKENPFIIKK